MARSSLLKIIYKIAFFLISLVSLLHGDFSEYLPWKTGTQLAKEEKEKFTEKPQQEILEKMEEAAEKTAVKEACDFKNLGAFSIADVFNANAVANALSFSKKFIMNNDQCFTHFNSAHDWNFWMNPYAFHANYGGSKSDFSMTTGGVALGGEYNFFDCLIFGGELGYFHSNLSWEKSHGTAHINAVHFGPYLGYLFDHGYVAASFFWIRNFYGGELKICNDEKKSINHYSWDGNLFLEGGYDIQLPMEISKDLHLYPFFKLHYTSISESAYEISKIKIKSRDSSYFSSYLAMKLAKTFMCGKSNVMIPGFILGWIKLTPLSSEKLRAEGESDKPEKKNVKAKGLSQLLLGAEVPILHQTGFLIAVDYEAHIGSNASMQLGKIRLEWNW